MKGIMSRLLWPWYLHSGRGTPGYNHLADCLPRPARMSSQNVSPAPLEAAKAVPGTKRRPRKINAAPIVQTTVHARPMLVQSYLQYRFCWRFLIRWIERR